LEVAAFGISKGEATSVDVVGQSPTPFARVFGAEIGARMTKVPDQNDVHQEYKGNIG
jgi:hypothetical protein